MVKDLVLVSSLGAVVIGGSVLLLLYGILLGIVGCAFLLFGGILLSFRPMKNLIVLDDDEDNPPRPEVIVLDDDSPRSPFPRPQRVTNGGGTTPTKLTEEQRKRIAQQKELAAQRRRNALEKRSCSSGSSSSSSSSAHVWAAPNASASSQAPGSSPLRNSDSFVAGNRNPDLGAWADGSGNRNPNLGAWAEATSPGRWGTDASGNRHPNLGAWADASSPGRWGTHASGYRNPNLGAWVDATSPGRWGTDASGNRNPKLGAWVDATSPGRWGTDASGNRNPNLGVWVDATSPGRWGSPGSETSEDMDTHADRWPSARKRLAKDYAFGNGTSGINVNDDRGVSAFPEDECESVEGVGKGVGEGEEQKAPPLQLSERQESVLKAVRDRCNVFLTGSAGTGKSFVLEHVIKELRKIHGSGVHVTASTGLAACALGGTTLHSFAGVGLGDGSPDSLVGRVRGRKDVFKRWMNAKALVIDEISMIDGSLFDKVDYVGRTVRMNPRPFGGLQLIVSGDFFQLPPVKPQNEAKYFAFQADCWTGAFDMQIELDIVFRQPDEDFVTMLNEIRRGRCSPAITRTLQNCLGLSDDKSGVVPTRLYPLRRDVSNENNCNLKALGEPIEVFTAMDRARNEVFRNQLANVGAVPELELCIGAQVMLAKNLDPFMGLVNGARGVVVSFTSPDDPRYNDIRKLAGRISPSGKWPIVKFADSGLERAMTPEDWTIMDGDEEVACRKQVPLILAWALSVHKCQGMTLNRVDTDLARAFDFGMIYVALSRVKSLKGLCLRGFNPAKIKVHPDVCEYYKALGSGTYYAMASRTEREMVPIEISE